MQHIPVLVDPTFIKGGIRIVHFMGLALGLGTATFLDLIIVRFMLRSKIRQAHADAFHFGTRVVTVGLLLLWVSGLGFLAHYTAFDPEKLGNPKIWAKLTIVVVLTVNAVYLHRAVLPLVDKQVSRTLFDGLSVRQCILMLMGGTTSATSWYVPLALGSIPQFNNSLAANHIWALFCALLIAANAFVITVFLGVEAFSRWRRGRPADIVSECSSNA